MILSLQGHEVVRCALRLCTVRDCHKPFVIAQIINSPTLFFGIVRPHAPASTIESSWHDHHWSSNAMGSSIPIQLHSSIQLAANLHVIVFVAHADNYSGFACWAHGSYRFIIQVRPFALLFACNCVSVFIF
jgi:hypothetical protein